MSRKKSRAFNRPQHKKMMYGQLKKKFNDAKRESNTFRMDYMQRVHYSKIPPFLAAKQDQLVFCFLESLADATVIEKTPTLRLFRFHLAPSHWEHNTDNILDSHRVYKEMCRRVKQTAKIRITVDSHDDYEGSIYFPYTPHWFHQGFRGNDSVNVKELVYALEHPNCEVPDRLQMFTHADYATVEAQWASFREVMTQSAGVPAHVLRSQPPRQTVAITRSQMAQTISRMHRIQKK